MWEETLLRIFIWSSGLLILASIYRDAGWVPLLFIAVVITAYKVGKGKGNQNG